MSKESQRLTVILTPQNLKWVRIEQAKRRELEGVFVPPSRLINELIRERREQRDEPAKKPVKSKAKAQTLPISVSA
jgi:hypothetical protein